MSEDTLDKIASEIGADAGQDAPAGEAETDNQAHGQAGDPRDDEPQAGMKSPDPMTLMVCTALARGLGNAVCKRASVEPLSGQEAGDIGEAVATLVAQFEYQLNPKLAALAMVCNAVVAAALPRINFEALMSGASYAGTGSAPDDEDGDGPIIEGTAERVEPSYAKE